MNEWGVVLVLIALVGLFMTIGKPVINLNTTMVQLSEQVKNLIEGSKDTKSTLCDHSKILTDHETRIHDLEGK